MCVNYIYGQNDSRCFWLTNPPPLMEGNVYYSVHYGPISVSNLCQMTPIKTVFI